MILYKVVEVYAPSELHDLLIASMLEIGFDSFDEQENKLLAYIPQDIFLSETLEQTLSSINTSEKISFEAYDLENKNWNEEWESNFNPIEIGDQCIIRASFHEVKKQFAYDIVINPQMSFGTGHHATTYQMVDYLLHIDLNHKTIMDAGTGTGILAILAEKKGGNQIVAYDVEDWAYHNAIDNVKINHCKNISVYQGTIQTIPIEPMEFDVLIANINKNVLLEEISVYYKFVKQGGTMLLSGFYEHDINDLLLETEKYNFTLNQTHVKENWAALLLTKH
jgi:ribosomal protein L11 methyltransferase